jgi:hypothetical protein
MLTRLQAVVARRVFAEHEELPQLLAEFCQGAIAGVRQWCVFARHRVSLQ